MNEQVPIQVMNGIIMNGDTTKANDGECEVPDAVRRLAKVREVLAERPLTGDDLFRQFFFELDHQTTPDNVVHSPALPVAVGRRRRESIDGLSSYLSRRVMARALALDNNQALPEQEPFADKIALQRISTLIWALSKRYFDPYDQIDEAFEKFANGQLRLEWERGRYSCEPDSGFYFLFAELAIACVEAEIDEEFWKDRLNALVRTQEIYLLAYAPSGPRKQLRNIFQKYRAANFTRSIHGHQVAQIRQAYKSMKTNDLTEQAGKNALWALKGVRQN